MIKKIVNANSKVIQNNEINPNYKMKSQNDKKISKNSKKKKKE